MIQIISCRCINSKFREAGTTFYSQIKFYEYIKEIFVVPCPRHPLLKEQFLNTNVNISCKTRCFALNFLADEIKVASILDIPSDVQLKKLMII